jgi:general stress protein CsbA
MWTALRRRALTSAPSNKYMSIITRILVNKYIVLLLGGIVLYAMLSAIYISAEPIIPIELVVLIAGFLFQVFYLYDESSSFISMLCISFEFSLMILLPGKHEHNYIFATHVAIWPYAFLAVLIGYNVLTLPKDRTVARLSEGTTLVQSLAYAYLLALTLRDGTSHLYMPILAISLVFIILSLWHAFTTHELSKRTQIWLSVWSSYVTLQLSIMTLFSVLQSEWLTETQGIRTFIVAIEYFVLGANLIFSIQNLFLLLRFIPTSTKDFFNKSYFKRIAPLKELHHIRYSDDQISPSRACVLTLLASSFLALSAHFSWFAPVSATWVTLYIFPYFIKLNKTIDV